MPTQETVHEEESIGPFSILLFHHLAGMSILCPFDVVMIARVKLCRFEMESRRSEGEVLQPLLVSG